MLTTWDQRMRRDKIKVTRIQFPVPTTQDDLYQRFEKAITPQTKVLHFCHITNLTGQLFPVQRICRWRALARHPDDRRRRARAGAFPVQAARPRVRLLRRQPAQVAARAARQRAAVRAQGERSRRPGRCRPRRRSAGERHPQVRGRSAPHPAALRAAVAEALAFHQAIGAERKAARLRYLTLRWANAVKTHPQVKMLSSLEPGRRGAWRWSGSTASSRGRCRRT